MDLFNNNNPGYKLNEIDPKTIPRFMSESKHTFNKNSLMQLPLPILKNMAIVISSEVKKNNGSFPKGYNIDNIENWYSKFEYVNFLDTFGMKIGSDPTDDKSTKIVHPIIEPPESDRSEEAENLRIQNKKLKDAINNSKDINKNNIENNDENNSDKKILIDENEKLKLEIEELKKKLQLKD